MISKKFLCCVCLVVLILSFALPASANSAQQYWYGADQAGVVITDGDSPIVVEHELLTFDLSEFPSQHYSNQEDFAGYGGKVTAEYTFYNPSDITVTATLAFPFGNMPGYGYGNDNDVLAKYGVTVNGENVDTTLRHTLSSGNSFNLDTDLPLLADGYIDNDFYNPDLTVTKYVFYVSDIDPEAKMPVHVALDLKQDEDGRVYYFPNQNSGHKQKDGDYRIGSFVYGRSLMVVLYVFGEPLTAMPDWKLYRDGSAKDGEEISGKTSLSETETMRFEDFALANYDTERGVSKIDWYNAVVTEMTGSGKIKSYPLVYLTGYKRDYITNLMRWYQYEITLAPGERIVNKVTAPIYPSIDEGYVPTVYEYTYLISPASSWSDFGSLDIVINTPYYMIDSSIEGFSKTEDGYKLSLDGLPEGELIFSLSTEEDPILKSRTPGGIAKNLMYFLAFLGLPILAGAVVLTVIILIIRRIVKK